MHVDPVVFFSLLSLAVEVISHICLVCVHAKTLSPSVSDSFCVWVCLALAEGGETPVAVDF